MHPEMMKPHIPLLAPGSSLIWIASLASSSALRPSHLPLLSLSALFFSYFFFFFFLNSITSKLEKETTALPFG